MTYSVCCLPVGRSEIPGPELFWMNAWDQWFPLTFQVVLVRGPGVVALVNGTPAKVGMVVAPGATSTLVTSRMALLP